MAWRLVIMPHDGRGSRSVRLGVGKIALVVVVLTCTMTSTLWLGWKLGEFIAAL